jgi:long-chain acyl-CoA synthetase
MLLGPNGQNIYPEEIEDKLNSMTMVVESIVVQRDNKLVALVYPDLDEAKNLGLSPDDLSNIMEQNRNGLNQMLPAYEKITEIEIHNEEFEKTPKRSIKRYLYT